MIQGKLLSDWDLHQYDRSEKGQIFFKLISKRHFSITKMNTSDLPACSTMSLSLHLFCSGVFFCKWETLSENSVRQGACYSAVTFFFFQILVYAVL